ncbi:hypothetical protein ACNO7O_09475, partial [Bisgaard Taxon 45]
EVRFELTEGVNPRRFSRPVPSTTRPFLRDLSVVNNTDFNLLSQAIKQGFLFNCFILEQLFIDGQTI